MKNRLVAAWLAITFLSSISCLAQTPAILGSRGTPLGVNVGMTIRQAVEALKPEQQTYALSGDSGWYLAIHGRASNEILMTLWSDGSQDYVINYAAKVEAITLLSSKYRTREGVHVGMSLKEAEAKMGKLKRIFTSEPTFEQYVEFANMPKGVSFGVSGGILKEGSRETQKYAADAQITKIVLSSW